MSRAEGLKEYREKCKYCESIRILRGTRKHSYDSDGHIVCDGHWNDGHWKIERTGFKCNGHLWREIK